MSKPQLPVLTHLQFLVLGVLRNEDLPGRTLREALSGLRHPPHRAGVLSTDGAAREGSAGRRPLRTDHGRRSGGHRAALPHHRRRQEALERGARVLRARRRGPPRNCGGPMPEFRRGLGRWLPREAERDLFHPSLEDLRARMRGGIRLQLATIALWIDCWRVWLIAGESRLEPATHAALAAATATATPSGRTTSPCLFRMLRRAFRIVPSRAWLHRRRGADARARHRRQHRALRRRRSGAAAAAAARPTPTSS